jgi:DNA mismatch repair ATPase MutL
MSLLFEESRDLLLKMGFETDEANNITSVPPEHPTDEESVRESVRELLSTLPEYAAEGCGQKLAATIARSMAAAEATSGGSSGYRTGDGVTPDRVLVDKLLACKEPALTPGGKPCMIVLTMEQIAKHFT